MHHHHPRLVLGHFVLQDVKDEFGDLVSHVRVRVLDILSVLDELRLVILTLTLQNVPVIETMLGKRIQVVLADDTGVVTISLHGFGERPLAFIERRLTVVVLLEAVDVAVLRGHHDGACRAAQRVGDKGFIESHAFVGKSIDMRRVDVHVIVSADCLHRVVIRHHEQDVRLLGRIFLLVVLVFVLLSEAEVNVWQIEVGRHCRRQ